MTDFTKIKVGFALALLAALFSLSPMLVQFGSKGFELFGIELKIDFFYYLILSLLGIAVYIYSIGFITEKPFGNLEKIGNIVYTSSVMVPVLMLVLWILSLLNSLFEVLLKSNYSEVVFSIISAIISSIITWVSFNYVNKRINLKDRNSLSAQFEKDELKSLKEAETLYNLGMYSATVTHAFSGLEFLVRKILVDRGLKKDENIKLFDYAIQIGIIASELKDDINIIRTIRNRAAHPIKDDEIDQVKAQMVMEITKRVVNSIYNLQ